MRKKIVTFGFLIVAIALSGCDKASTNGPNGKVSGAASPAVTKEQDQILLSAKAAVSSLLIDSQSAQFSELKFYELTNAVCGSVNAKNRMGGYTGSKEFIYVHDKNLAVIAPSSEMPPAPVAPGSSSVDATLNFIQESQKWQEEMRKISQEKELYGNLRETRCTDDKARLENAKKEAADKIAGTSQFREFKVIDGFIEGYNGNYIYSGANLSQKLSPALKKIYTPRGVVETTKEYSARLNYSGLMATEGVNLDAEYGLVVVDGNAKSQDKMFAGKDVKYNPDVQKLTLSSEGVFDVLCKDPAKINMWNINRSKAYGITCDVNGAGEVLLSSAKDQSFLKSLAKDDYGRLYLKASFKISPEDFVALPKTGYSEGRLIGIMIVGKVDPQLQIQDINQYFKDPASERFPFTVSRVVYYNSDSGKVLHEVKMASRN